MTSQLGRKLRKQQNLAAGEDALEILVSLDYQVVQLSPHHFRVNGELDIWPSTKRWWNKRYFTKGSYDDLVPFVKKHFTK